MIDIGIGIAAVFVVIAALLWLGWYEDEDHE